MNNPENNKWLDEKLSKILGSEKTKPDFEQWKKEHSQAVKTLSSRAKDTKVSKRPYNLRNIIMKNKATKIASAAVILIAVGLSITIFNWLTTPAWAIEETVQALKETKSIIISGTTVYDGSKYLEFKCLVKFNSDNENMLLRFESPRELVVVRDNKAYCQKPGSNRVQIYEGDSVNSSVSLWSEIMELSPWLNGKILKSFKLLANDWQEEYSTDEKTGREIVFVKCSFNKLFTSFAFIFDVENKLIVEGKQWNNSNYKDPVNIYADSFVYNANIPDEVFNFKIPENAEVVHIDNDPEKQKQVESLSNEAENLFHKEKKYAEALDLYKQVYEKFPDLNNGTHAANAMMMAGICYGWLGQQDKAIEVFLKEIEEYNHLDGLEVTFFYLGSAYLDEGQKDKAIEAFENCLKIGESKRDPDKFPLKDARETIDKLKKQN